MAGAARRAGDRREAPRGARPRRLQALRRAGGGGGPAPPRRRRAPRPEDGRRWLPYARGGGCRRCRRFLLQVQRVVVVGGAREEDSHGDAAALFPFLVVATARDRVQQPIEMPGNVARQRRQQQLVLVLVNRKKIGARAREENARGKKGAEQPPKLSHLSQCTYGVVVGWSWVRLPLRSCWFLLPSPSCQTEQRTGC